MRHGLPIITTDIGGPGHIVDPECGISVAAKSPEQFAADLATAIATLKWDSDLRKRLGAGARHRVSAIGLWGPKIDRMIERYREIAES
jgi:glycosyltransferase involved in cell wall biosynthesis